jgi:hypothetical protein
MEPREREMAQRRGRRKLDAMKRRTGLLRRRVVATAIVGFVLLWTVVFVQMATGNDPVLGTVAGTRPAAKRKRAVKLERSPAAVEPEASEAASIEAERAEAERVEIEQREAEARELEEFEAVTTGQS